MDQLFITLEKRALQFPEQDALISSDGKRQTIFSNQQLLDDITRVGAFFEKEHLQCIALYMDNCAQWIICDLAAAKLDITVVPIPLFFTPSQVDHLVTSTGVEAIITQSLISALLTSNALLNIENANIILPIDNALMLRVVTEKTVNLANSIKITYTSGTTGEPKGVCLSAENIGTVCWGIEQTMNTMVTTSHLCVLPLAILLENVGGVYACLMQGGVVITEPLTALGFLSNAEFDIKQLLGKIEQYQVGSIILLPQMLKLLVHGVNAKVLQQCSSLHLIGVGGGKSSVAILEQANALGLPVCEGYGLSECGSVVCSNFPSQEKVGSVGKALPHVNVEISDEGEIVIKGQAMLGYLGELDQSLTDIHTGDLGYIDEEGYIFVSGRKNNKIVSSFGRNISPEWVEASLSSSSVIAQVAVFGEAQPSLSAVIVSPIDDIKVIDKAIEACNKHLPDYAQIRHWISAKHAFTSSNDLLTKSGGLKRRNIEQVYQQQLDALYA